MEMELWIVLLISFVLGLAAAWISQFAAARKGLEAKATAKTLREELDSRKERNNERQQDLRISQKALRDLTKIKLQDTAGQIDANSLKEAIEGEGKSINKLNKAMIKSDEIIAETRAKLEELDKNRSLNSGWLLFISGAVGGVTAVIFGLIGYLGMTDEETLASIDSDVRLTSTVIVQSLALGAGWPLVWERLFSGKLKDIANEATTKFHDSIKDIEKEEAEG